MYVSSMIEANAYQENVGRNRTSHVHAIRAVFWVGSRREANVLTCESWRWFSVWEAKGEIGNPSFAPCRGFFQGGVPKGNRLSHIRVMQEVFSGWEARRKPMISR